MPNRAEKAKNDAADFSLDITDEICPLTFVKTKLLIEQMQQGQTADVRLCGAEPLRNVPRAIQAQGHEIVSFVPEDTATAPEGAHWLRLRKR